MLKSLREFYVEFSWMNDTEFLNTVLEKLEKLNKIPVSELTSGEKKRIKLIPEIKALLSVQFILLLGFNDMNRRMKKELARLGFKNCDRIPLACMSIKLLILMSSHQDCKKAYLKQFSLLCLFYSSSKGFLR